MFERVLLGGLLAVLSVVAFGGDSLSVADQAAVDRWLGEQREPATTSGPAAERSAPPVESLLSRLEQRVEQTPGDRSGWSLLAQTYAFLGRMDAAREAAARAVELGEDAEQLQRRLVAAHTERAGRN